MQNKKEEVLSPDYYAILTDPNTNVIINDIRFIQGVLTVIDNKYITFVENLKKAIVKEQAFNNLDKVLGDQLYRELIATAEKQKEKLKKDIIVSGHLANISNKTTIRTAVLFYRDLRTTVSQQLDLAFSLIISRLRTLYLKDMNNG